LVRKSQALFGALDSAKDSC